MKEPKDQTLRLPVKAISDLRELSDRVGITQVAMLECLIMREHDAVTKEPLEAEPALRDDPFYTLACASAQQDPEYLESLSVDLKVNVKRLMTDQSQ